jgi:cell wall-associated NlpC family hydrolase
MSRNRVAISAATVAFLALMGCTPYPVYNSSNTGRAQRAHAESNEDEESNPADHEPAVESRDLEPESPGGVVVERSTTIDPRLFKRVVDTYVGAPYKRGGSNLHGIDCSNLVASIYRDYDGTKLPESTRGLLRLSDVIELDQLQIGDLVFFKFAETRSPSHVGVYLGDTKFVHSSETNGVVISSIEESAYRSAYYGARRVAPRLHSGE